MKTPQEIANQIARGVFRLWGERTLASLREFELAELLRFAIERALAERRGEAP